MKEDVGYEEFLAAVYEAETEGTEGKVLNVKAKAMTVKKVVEKKEPTNLQDLKQQIESLATIMKSTTMGNVRSKEGEGISSPKKKEMFRNSPKKAFQGSPRKGKGVPKPGQKPIKCYRCDGWGHGWKECPTQENLNWRELVGAVVPLTSRKFWLHSCTDSRAKSVISKVLRQSDLYHNPDPLGRLVGEANESNVIVEGWETRALLDSGSQLLAISWTWVKELNLKP